MKLASVLAAVMAILPMCAAPSYVYVANQGSNSISKIDRTTNKVVATIPVSNGPTQMALNPNGKYLYVTTQASTVDVIALATNAVIKTISFTGSVWMGQIAVTPNGAVAYVANVYTCGFQCQTDTSSLTAFSTVTYSILANIGTNLDGGTEDDEPYGVAITPNGSLLFEIDPYNDLYTFVATATNSVLNVQGLPVTYTGSPYGNDLLWMWPVAVAITPDGMSAFITDQYYFGGGPAGTPGIVWRMDTSGYAFPTVHILVGAGPVGIAINPNGRFGYTANSIDNTVTVFCAIANVPLATVPVGNNPQQIALTPDGAFVYVTNSRSNTISVINTETNKVVATIPVGKTPIGLAVLP